MFLNTHHAENPPRCVSGGCLVGLHVACGLEASTQYFNKYQEDGVERCGLEAIQTRTIHAQRVMSYGLQRSMPCCSRRTKQ
jgi:hypothetical protein